VAGKADVHDPVLKSLLQESRDIEKFQFIYRLKADTMADIRKLTTWMATYNIGVTRLQKMRRWVDASSDEIVNQPPKHYVPTHLVFAFLAMITVIGFGPLASSRDAYLQMRASKVWFKTDAVTVKAPLEGWSFDRTNCAADKDSIAQLTGFNASETDIVCEGLKQDGLKPLVKKTVEFQAWTGIAGALIAIALAFGNILAAGSAQEALRLRKRLYQSREGNNEEDRTGRATQTESQKPTTSRRRNPPKATPEEVDAHHQSEPQDQ
jgi:hypothetical protein